MPKNRQHGGPGWEQQFPGGEHKHRYPNGTVRSHYHADDSGAVVLGGILIIGSSVAILLLIADDATLVGIANDAAIPAAIGSFMKGVEMVVAR